MPIIRKYNGINLSAPGDGVTNNYTTPNITGTTSETILSSVLVPANTFKLYDIIDIESRLTKNTTGLATIRIRIGTTVSLGATLIATFTSSSTTHTYIPIYRRLTIKNLTSGTETVDATTSTLADFRIVSLVNSNISIDWTVDQYVIITGQPTSTSTVINCPFVILKHIDGSL